MSKSDGWRFLAQFSSHYSESELRRFTTAQWLLNDFDSRVWVINFDQKVSFRLDWGVELENGTLLTDPENRVLDNSLRHYLIIAVDGPNGEYKDLSRRSAALKFASVTKLVDYLLLNSESYGLLEHGLAGLNLDDLRSILSQLASSDRSEESIYEWSARVAAYCAQLIVTTSDDEVTAMLLKFPSMAIVSQEQEDDNHLDINVADVPKIRVALKKAGLYYGNDTNSFAVSGKRLSEEIYGRTLRGRETPKSKLEIFSYYPRPARYRREFPAVDVTTGESEILQRSTYLVYRQSLMHSSTLASLGYPAPAIEDVQAIREYLPPVNPAARFRSVPSDILLKTFEQGLEFYFEHGRAILDGFVRVARYCNRNQCALSNISDDLLSKIIGDELLKLGVKRLGLSSPKKTVHRIPRKKTKDLYFQELRANVGLLELVSVLIGVIQFVVGVIMARRADELVNLDAEKCLDKTRSWLFFNLAKSTRRARGLRLKEARPIDAVAAEMIEELQDFQRLLKRFKFIEKPGTIFASPSFHGVKGLISGSLGVYNRNLDFMCDYFETGVTDAGKRYYFRQHQLRRFFAIVFFYMNGFGELDTLRWMLGHTDVEHVWRYLSESLGPKDIRGAGARYFTDLAKKERLENYQDLQALLEARFGTKKLRTVPEEQIEEYLEAMMQEGKARIEPHFFHDENGKAMRILFIVS